MEIKTKKQIPYNIDYLCNLNLKSGQNIKKHAAPGSKELEISGPF
jgi:phosphatidate phosphatase PAH1